MNSQNPPLPRKMNNIRRHNIPNHNNRGKFKWLCLM